MPKKEFRATKNLTLGHDSGVELAKGAKHAQVKKGEIVEIEESYAAEHLVPHGHVEDPDEEEKREEAALVEEHAKLDAKKAALTEKHHAKKSAKTEKTGKGKKAAKDKE